MSPLRKLLVCLITCCLLSCGQGEEHAVGHRAIQIDVWLPAGDRNEQKTVQAQVADFNASQYRVRVNAVILPETDYDRRILEAAEQGKLPDIIELPSDRIARYAWRGIIRPIDKFLTDETHDRLLPPLRAANSYEGRIYAVPSHARSVLLYARRDVLTAQGLDLPPLGRTWDLDQFSALLARLAKGRDGRPVLEVDLGPAGHPATGVLLPALASAGGGLIDLHGRPRVLGVFDSMADISVLSTIRDWERKGWLTVRPVARGGRFVDGSVPLAWAWSRDGDRYRRRWGDAVTVLPLPDFGHGRRFLMDGWGWAVTRDSTHVQAAMSLLEFMSEDERLSVMARASHDLPAGKRILADWAREGLDEAVLLHGASRDEFVVVPPTPAYPLIARTLGKVVSEILSGRPPGPLLHDEALALQHKIAGFEDR